MTKLLYILVPVLVFLLFSGCDRHVDLDYLEVIEDEVPVTIRKGPISSQRIAFILEEVLRLQQDPEIPESLLFNPTRFVMDLDGVFYVIDQGNSRIAVFGSDGRYRRSFGRKGDGPGEFDAIMLVRFSKGVLTIWDPVNWRTTQYLTNGKLLNVIRVPEEVQGTSTIPPGTSYIPTREGKYLTWHRYTEANDKKLYVWIEIRISGVDLEQPMTIRTTPALIGTSQSQSTLPGTNEVLSVPIPFTGMPAITFTTDERFLVSEGDTPELAWYDLNGNLLRKARIETQPRRFSSTVKQAMRNEVEESERQMATRMGRHPRPYNEGPLPECVGFSSGDVTVDEFGYVWLKGVWGPGELGPGEPVLSSEARATAPVHVFNPNGRYLGVCRIPGYEASIMQGYALVIVREPISDTQTPVVFRIVPALENLTYP